jgi:hypothetical protein
LPINFLTEEIYIEEQDLPWGSPNMSAKKRCFVIMPFSKTERHTEQYWTAHFEYYLKPIIEESGNLEAFRSEALRGDILKQIITDLVVSPVVVADLTDANPNVYWELGIRQSFKHGTVTIAEEGTKIQFDLSVKGILYYSDDHMKNEKFRSTLKEALRDCLEHQEKPDSHVLETLSGRGTLFEIFRIDETVRRIQALISEWSWNMETVKHIYKTIDDNTADPAHATTVTSRLSSLCLGLLVSTRYLDEDQLFYDKAQAYLVIIDTINEMLSRWGITPNIGVIQKWFLDTKEAYNESFEEYKRALDDAVMKLIKKNYQ